MNPLSDMYLPSSMLARFIVTGRVGHRHNRLKPAGVLDEERIYKFLLSESPSSVCTSTDLYPIIH